MNNRLENALKILLLPVLLFLFAYNIKHNSNNYKFETKIKLFKPIINKLINDGADSEVIYYFIKNPQIHFNEKYLKINLIKRPRPTQQFQIKSTNINSIKKFIKNYEHLLSEVENKYGIPPNIIGSLLWVETKLGQNLGTHHLLSVYFTIALSDQPEYFNSNFSEIIKASPDSISVDSLWNIYFKRAREKSSFAANEIKSLVEMHKMGYDVMNLYGSFSGAFGIPQFLPSSFLKYAIDGNDNNLVNLFEMEDAIASVANYLNKNGYANNDSQKLKNALFRYNPSWDYVNRVLEIASKIK